VYTVSLLCYNVGILYYVYTFYSEFILDSVHLEHVLDLVTVMLPDPTFELGFTVSSTQQ